MWLARLASLSSAGYVATCLPGRVRAEHRNRHEPRDAPRLRAAAPSRGRRPRSGACPPHGRDPGGGHVRGQPLAALRYHHRFRHDPGRRRAGCRPGAAQVRAARGGGGARGLSAARWSGLRRGRAGSAHTSRHQPSFATSPAHGLGAVAGGGPPREATSPRGVAAPGHPRRPRPGARRRSASARAAPLHRRRAILRPRPPSRGPGAGASEFPSSPSS